MCAAVLRVFGTQLAELPLVATSSSARRQGHCRVLMAILEDKLKGMGISVLSLPAAKSAVRRCVRVTHTFSSTDLNTIDTS